MNETLGSGIEKLGGTVAMIGMAQHSVHALGTAYEYLASQEVIANALASPLAWAGLAGVIAVAAAAATMFKSSSQEAANAARDALEETKNKAIELRGVYKEIAEANTPRAHVGPGGEITEKPAPIKEHDLDRIQTELEKALIAQRTARMARDNAMQGPGEELTIFDRLKNEFSGKNQQAGSQAEAVMLRNRALQETTETVNRLMDAEKNESAVADAAVKAREKEKEKKVLAAAHEKNEEANDKLRDEIGLMNESADAKMLDRILSSNMAADEKQGLWMVYEAQLEANEAEKEHQELMQRGKAITESMLTPRERLIEKLQEYNRLVEVGALGEGKLGQARYDRAVKAAGLEYQKQTQGKTGPDQLPTVKEEGSAEAWRTIVTSMYGADKDKNVEAIDTNTAELIRNTEAMLQTQHAESVEEHDF
jgi:hypothetical protein